MANDLIPPGDVKFPKKTVVGDWKIVRHLGHGGQGSVWEVRRVRGKAPPAALKACFAADAKARERFLREMKLLADCASAHVLPIRHAENEWQQHIGAVPPFAYYVSELCQGTLEDERERSQDFTWLTSLVRQACEAVSLLHSRDAPVIHRDLKPSNFLLATEPRRLVLADFGIAKEAEGESPLTETNEVVGSPFFRAPEVLNGSGGTERSDIYSMGRILEWLLTGRLPENMVPRSVPRGGSLADDACDVFDRVILKATAVDPSQRYASIEEMKADLPELWLGVRPRPEKPRALVVASPDDAVREAIALARAEDWIGWRQLENSIRAAFPPSALEWRAKVEGTRPLREENLPRLAEELVGAFMPRAALALVGATSGRAAVDDQRRVIEDLLEMDGWNRGGLTVAINAPRSLLFVFTHLHGAACMQVGRHELAIRFAQAPVERRIRSGEPPPLWRAHDLAGWPELMGGKCTVAWGYLMGLWDRHDFLREFFPLARDFQVGLAAHGMLLSLLELATDSKSLVENDRIEDIGPLDVPAMFATMDSDLIGAAHRRVYGDGAVVEDTLRHARANPDDVRRLWPGWVKAIKRFAVEVTGHRLWLDDIDLASLTL